MEKNPGMQRGVWRSAPTNSDVKSDEQKHSATRCSSKLAAIALASLVALAACASSPAPRPPVAVAAAAPIVSSCYDLSKQELEGMSPTSAPVDCLAMHNAETYFVKKWSGSKTPYQLSASERLVVATKSCQPWNVAADSVLNYWVFFVPTKADWDKGARWIRCDAMNQFKDQAGNLTFDAWTGLIYKGSPSPKAGALVPAGESVYIYIEPSSGCFSDASSPLQADQWISVRDAAPSDDPFRAPILASAQLYGREAGCGLGANFTLRSSHHPVRALIVNDTTKTVMGYVDLTEGGNTSLYLSAK